MMSKQHVINGSCHCGNIRYTFYTSFSPQQLSYRTCDCSFCRKRGIVYTSEPHGSVELSYSEEVSVYQFASKDVEFVSCKTCGVMTHALCALDTRQFAVLNANSFESIPLDRHITTKNFTNESRDVALQRRYRNWIGDVIIR